MNESGFETIDYIIFGAYIVLLICLGLFLSRNKNGKEKNANDYFLAGNTLTWWAVGASLIAANISAEQFIGMSGSGYKIGLYCRLRINGCGCTDFSRQVFIANHD